MSADSFDDLLRHVGHEIECATYGDEAGPVNAAIECMTCYEVLLDFDREARDVPRDTRSLDEGGDSVTR